MATTFDKKCEILADLWFDYRGTKDPVWAEYFRVEDLSLPCAFAQNHGFITIDDQEMIEDAFKELLEMIGITSDTGFNGLSDVFDASPHPRITP
jgi:hypothetical protein